MTAVFFFTWYLVSDLSQKRNSVAFLNYDCSGFFSSEYRISLCKYKIIENERRNKGIGAKAALE